MLDRAFEIEIDRAFGEAPMLPDAEVFAMRVSERLNRGWTFRRLLIGGLGLAGGLIGAAQFVSSGLINRLDSLGARSGALARIDLANLPAARGLSDLMSTGYTVNGQVLWMSVAMAILAVVLFVTRVIRDI